jgi:hypothetical protein
MKMEREAAMPIRYKLELEVVLEAEDQAKLIDLARRQWASEDGSTDRNGRGGRCRITAGELIDGTEPALLVLLAGNSLLPEVGVVVERISCASVAVPADDVELGAFDGEHAHDQEEELDEFESGLYLCRWPNGDFSVVKADTRRDALIELDEWAGADPAWLIPISTWMVDFRLNDQGEIELAEFGEETTDLVWDRCYPELESVLSRIEVTSNSGDRCNLRAAHKIKKAVEHERKRLWSVQHDNSAPAKTAIGRELQKCLRTVGAVADHYVEQAAGEILRGRAGEKSKPN